MTTSVARTQDALPTADKIVPVKQGEPAPITGFIFPEATALRWRTTIKDYQFKLETLPKAEQEKCQVRLNLVSTEASMRLDVEAARTEVYRRKVIELEKPAPFYENPWFTFGTGAVLSGLLSGFIIWQVSK